jgi:coproporphyrinogen III oxidase-like Fe-S oxidoreductase
MTLKSDAMPYVVRLPNMGKHLYPPPLTKIAASEFTELLNSTPRGGPLAHLYLHFPFCESICTFCVLHKFQLRPTSPVREYIDALKRELLNLSQLPLVQQLRFNNVYFGGGTPSVVDNRYLAEVMQVINDNFALDEPQITFEGHVQSLTREKMRFVRSLGFNRISTGVQTFDPILRQKLNLTPTEADIFRCATDARTEGFDDFNVDMMYNLPGQTTAMWEDDLLKAVALHPSGMDVYETVVTRRTGLSRQVERGDLALERDAKRLTDNYLLSEAILSANGYQQRNVHVWDQPGYENRLVGQQDLLRDHELTLVGAGLSAYSFIDGMPFINATGLRDYIRRVEQTGHGVEAYHKLSLQEEMERFMTLSLQTIDFDRWSFATLFGREMEDVFRPQITSFLRRGLIVPNELGYRLTALGRAWASTMTMEFFGPSVLEEFMRTRLETEQPPGYAADIPHEEMFEFAVFAIFHPRLIFKGRPNLKLLRAHVRYLSRTNPGWLRKVAYLVWEGIREFGPPPVTWYVPAVLKLLCGKPLS